MFLLVVVFVSVQMGDGVDTGARSGTKSAFE